MRLVVTAFAVLCLACALLADAKPRGGGGAYASHSSAKHSSTSSHTPRSSAKATSSSGKANTKVQGVQRNAKGRIARDPEQRAKFERSHPCPSTGKRSGACPGYVVDHVRPLKRGGTDRPDNMQWQTTQAAKQKDRTE